MVNSYDSVPSSGECCGNITISVFKDEHTGFRAFKVHADNEDILPITYVIEDTLKLY